MLLLELGLEVELVHLVEREGLGSHVYLVGPCPKTQNATQSKSNDTKTSHSANNMSPSITLHLNIPPITIIIIVGDSKISTT